VGKMAPPKPRIIGIVAREGLRSAYDLALKTIKMLHSRGFTIFVVSPLKHEYAKAVDSTTDLKNRNLEAILTIGGDGTIIRVIRDLDCDIPVIGVAGGGRGIMAEVRATELPKAIERFYQGKYYLDHRMRLIASIDSKLLTPALNEVLLMRKSYTVTPTYTICIQKNVKLNQRMDGLMISSPTGSTGHSYALGGPVITEQLDVFLLTPICPITRLPSLVIPTLPVEILSNQPTIVVVDGQEVYHTKGSVLIKVKRHTRDAVFVRFSQRSLGQLTNLGFG
jgi:NAD+ kinase